MGLGQLQRFSALGRVEWLTRVRLGNGVGGSAGLWRALGRIGARTRPHPRPALELWQPQNKKKMAWGSWKKRATLAFSFLKVKEVLALLRWRWACPSRGFSATQIRAELMGPSSACKCPETVALLAAGFLGARRAVG